MTAYLGSWINQAIIAASLVTFVPACGSRYAGDSHKCKGDDCTANKPGTTVCTTANDCDAGQTCTGGVCAADPNAGEGDPAGGGSGEPSTPTACQTHADCAAGEHCSLATSQCVECLNDDHCPSGTVCRSSGDCGPPDASVGCTSDNDCNGLRCLTARGACVACIGNADCGSGESCSDNRCVASGGPPSCTSQRDCDGYGKICDTASRRCVACTADSQCASGLICRAGICSTATGGGGGGGGSTGSGGGSTGSGGGSTCATSAECGGEACYYGECTPCVMDFMCNDDADAARICDADTGLCTDPECVTAYDCATGLGCYSGHCGECWYDDECRAGETCGYDGICARTSSGGTGGGTTGGGGATGGGGSSGGFGDTCAGQANDCGAGLICLSGDGGGYCSRTCIGSGKGGDADCPSGYACYNFESTALDGLSLCLAASDFSSDYPARGFDQAPGASCAASNRCQTSICLSDDTCARTCLANRDCGSGEVCWAVWDGEESYGIHMCAWSDTTGDTTSYTPAGGACSSGAECDSGVCMGQCTGGAPCNSSADCSPSGGTCTGVCRDHCRANSDCGSGDTCNPWPVSIADGAGMVPICMPRVFAGTRTDGAACTQDNQCASDWCVSGICTTLCAITADCGGNLSTRHCLPVTFVDANQEPVYALALCL